MPSRSALISFLIVSAALTASPWAYILTAGWPVSGDLIFYANCLKEFSAQLWAGDVYPRWLTGADGGLGSPVFLFFGPLIFYIASLFAWLAPFDPNGFARLLIVMALGLFVGGITCYRWLRCLMERQRAEEGALLYIALLYAVNCLHTGIAVPQLWGGALFPFLLEAAFGIKYFRWRAVPKFAAAIALLCFAHMPSLVLFIAVPIVFAGRNFLPAIVACALGLGMAGLYLVPALANTPFIAAEAYFGGQDSYRQAAMAARSWAGILLVGVPVVALYVALPAPKRSVAQPDMRFWLVVMMCMMLMMSPLSRPLWDHIALLQTVRYPFRFTMGMLPGLVYIVSCWLPQVRRTRCVFALLAMGVAGGAMLDARSVFYDFFNYYEEKPPVAALLDQSLITPPEYETWWMQESGVHIHLSMPQQWMDMPPVALLNGEGHAEITDQNARMMTLHAHVESAQAVFTLRRFYFPGWQAQGVNDVAIENHQGLLAVTLLQGDYDITLGMPWFRGEQIGLATSIIALLLWGAILRRRSAWLAIAPAPQPAWDER